MLLQVILAAEFLLTATAGVRLESGVNPLVPGQFLVARERFLAIRSVAFEGSLASVDAHVVPELSIVGEARFAIEAMEILLPDPVRLFGRLMEARLLVAALHLVHVSGRHDGVDGEVGHAGAANRTLRLHLAG